MFDACGGGVRGVEGFVGGLGEDGVNYRVGGWLVG